MIIKRRYLVLAFLIGLFFGIADLDFLVEFAAVSILIALLGAAAMRR